MLNTERKTPKQSKIPAMTRLRSTTYDKVKRVAEQRGESYSQVIEAAVELYVAQRFEEAQHAA